MIGFSTVAETISCRAFPSGYLPVPVAARKKKNERNEIVCFCCDQSDILFCGIARFNWGNKKELRTFQPQK